MKKVNPVLISGKEVIPLIEGGKGIAVSDGQSSGAWAKAGAVGTISGVFADEYDENGRLLKVESKSNAAESKTVVYETNESGKETRTERFGNGSIRKYDEKGNLTYYEGLTEGYGNLTYDENGRLVSAEWSVNYTKKTVEFTYEEKGHMASATVTQNGRTVVYTFTEYKAYYIPDANIRNALYKKLYFGAKRVG